MNKLLMSGIIILSIGIIILIILVYLRKKGPMKEDHMLSYDCIDHTCVQLIGDSGKSKTKQQCIDSECEIITPELPTRYYCDKETSTCTSEHVTTNEAVMNYATTDECQTNCSKVTSRYACQTADDEHSPKCIQNDDGPYTSIDSCNSECKYKCDPVQGKCIRDKSGTFDSMLSCMDSQCDMYKWGCNNDGTCTQNADGLYDSKTECLDMCNFTCNPLSGECSTTPEAHQCLIPNTCGSQQECTANCKAYKWGCDNVSGTCIQKTDSTGIFDTAEECNASKCEFTCLDDSHCGNGTCNKKTGECACTIIDTADDYIKWTGEKCDTIEDGESCPVGRFMYNTGNSATRDFTCKKCKEVVDSNTWVPKVMCSGKGHSDTTEFTERNIYCGTSNYCSSTPSRTINEPLGLDKDEEDLTNCSTASLLSRWSNQPITNYVNDGVVTYSQSWPWADQHIRKCSYNGGISYK